MDNYNDINEYQDDLNKSIKDLLNLEVNDENRNLIITLHNKIKELQSNITKIIELDSLQSKVEYFQILPVYKDAHSLKKINKQVKSLKKNITNEKANIIQEIDIILKKCLDLLLSIDNTIVNKNKFTIETKKFRELASVTIFEEYKLPLAETLDKVSMDIYLNKYNLKKEALNLEENHTIISLKETLYVLELMNDLLLLSNISIEKIQNLINNLLMIVQGARTEVRASIFMLEVNNDNNMIRTLKK